jgi:putative thioredoxin
MQTTGSFSMGGTVSGSAGAPQGGAGLIKDTTTANFRADVLTESMRQPVLVDFWAPWCGPCKQLTPVIEKAVAAARGKVKLVKMNIDDHPEIAGQLGIQSIPAVVAFSKGKPVDAFMGAVPESQVKAFIDKVAGPGGADAMIEEALEAAAKMLAAGDAAGAAEAYAGILAHDPESTAALAGLISAQLEAGNVEQARRLIDSVPEAKRGDKEIAAALARVELAEQAASLGDVKDLEAAIAANPADCKARFDLALALNARDRREEAAEQLLEIIKRDRSWDDDGARRQLLQLFEAWGPMDEATISARRRLSAYLFR